MRKKTAIFLLLTLALLGMTTVANASIRASQYITSFRAIPARASDSTVVITIDIVGTSTMDVIGAKTIVFQEKAPGSSTWSTAATYNSSSYPNMLSYNTWTHDADIYYYGAKAGYSYRAKVYFYAEKGGYDTEEYITSAV